MIDWVAIDCAIRQLQRRHFSLHYHGPIDLSAELVPSPDYGPSPNMPGADEPTLTRRALVD